MKKYSAPIAMAIIALVLISIHFYSGWVAAVHDAQAHHQAITIREYVVQWVRDTTENLQSEFLQLAVQFLVLSGALGFMKIHAYEQDVEDIKKELSDIKELLRS